MESVAIQGVDLTIAYNTKPRRHLSSEELPSPDATALLRGRHAQ